MGSRGGQAMLEYILVFIALIGLVWAVMRFAVVAKTAAVETAEQVSSDYP